MKKALTIILFFLLKTQPYYGQYELGLKVSGGFSRITNNINSPGTKQTLYFSPSGQGGFFYSFNLGSKSILNVELLFTQMQGREKLEIPYLDQYGNPTDPYVTVQICRHISYISLPIYYGIKFKKISLNLGIQTSLVIISSGRERGPSWDNKYDELNIDPYDFGPRAGIIFHAFKRVSIEGNYYYGINNILNENVTFPEWFWRTQQINVGVRYSFILREKRNTKTE